MTKGKVTKAINELKQDLVILLDLQKYVPQKEYHLEVIKAHRDGLLKEMQARNIPIPQFTNHVTDKNVCWRRERKRGRRGEEEERRFEGAISKSSNMRATNATFKKVCGEGRGEEERKRGREEERKRGREEERKRGREEGAIS